MAKKKQEFHYVDFTIVRDKQEKAPFLFHDIEARAGEGGRHVVVESEVKHLKTGDYSIIGLEDVVTVERKSVDDLCNCILSDRNRSPPT